MRTIHLSMRTIASVILLVMAASLHTSPVGATPVVWTDKTVYDQGEMITVFFSGAPGFDSDWICIIPAGAPDTDGGDYQYMPRAVGQGSLTFAPRPPGKYEARAYYNYRRNGYVVSGRSAFSVAGAPDLEPSDQGAGLADPYDSSSGSGLPPPIVFAEPPNVVVLPGTDVYAAPDVQVDIFFQGGWWWRPWDGRWYRSRYHDRGWSYYGNPPSWYRGIPHDWRQGYRNRVWGGRPWNPPPIHHGNLNDHWRGGHWRNDHGLGSQGRPGRPGVVKPGVTPGKPAPPDHPGAVKPGAGPAKPPHPTVGPGGGQPPRGPAKPAPPAVRPGGGQPGSPAGKPAPRGSGSGEGKPGKGSGGAKPGDGSGKPLTGFGYENRPEPGGR